MKDYLDVLARVACTIKQTWSRLQVARIGDIPYYTSPPMQLVYQSTATLTAGVYLWDDDPGVLATQRNLVDNALYFIRNITLTADVESLDFETSVTTIPEFYMFRQSDGGVRRPIPLLREPILMPSFLKNFDYRLVFETKQGNDQVLGAFRGQLIQSPGLIGKNTITLTAQISVQEIVDKNYINLFKTAYPITGRREEEALKDA